MTPDLLGVDPEVVELIRPDRDWERGVTEAPTVLRRVGLVHLFYSGGPYQGAKDAGNYGVGHATARSLRGPYQKDDRPLLRAAEGKAYHPGHQTVVDTPDGSSWVLYHAWDAQGQPRYGQNPAGRTLRLDRLEWDGGTPRMEGPTVGPRPAPRGK